MAKPEEFEMPKDLDEYFKIAKDPLVKHSNMVMEMRDEVVDIIVQFTEGKYANDYEKSSNLIKENLDKKFGSPWHVVVGRHFSFDVTCEARHMVHVFTGGQMACLAWKH